MTPAGVSAEPTVTDPVRRLLTDIAADPRARLVAGVCGPAGTGKTPLLADVADGYLDAGLAVRREPPAPDDGVLLIDDAHLRTPAELAELTHYAAGESARLVVAYRPWPASAALAELPHTRPRLRLGHLDAHAIADRITTAQGNPPAAEVVERILAGTGGLPRLVEYVASGQPGVEIDWAVGVLEGLPACARELVVALACGAESDVDVLAAVLGRPADEITGLLECAWSAGLLDVSGRVIGLAVAAVDRTVGAIVRQETRRRIAQAQLDRGGPVLATGRLLLAVGARGPRAADALVAAGDEALAETPELAAELFNAAIAAGAAPTGLAARRAEAAALAGDLDGALCLAERALTAGPPDRDRAATVAATALAQRGMLSDSAALGRSAEPGAASGAVMTALLGVGDLAAANRELAALDRGRRPGLSQAVGSLIARGLHHTVAGRALVGLSELMQAARLLSGRRLLVPEPPAALAALVAIQLGEPDVAASTIVRALGDLPPDAPEAVRCQLLRGWIALQRGELAAVEATLARVAPREPRDELYAAALTVGLARRRTDLAGLMAAWPRTREALLTHPVDLYMMQPLGEIAVAAAKLREDHLLAEHLYQAEQLLDRLGRPVLWTGPLHWYGLHAAIAAESPGTAVRHARSMALLATGGRCAAALSRAGSAWLRVLAGEVDLPAVTGAARAIQSVGLAWDAARLAAQAAVRTDDRKAMASLLGLARALHDADQPPAPVPPVDGAVVLSNREREVAALLVEGMTYKQIGERLFISAKTVEHHIARIRRRMGDPGRRELLARLRALVAS